MQLAILAPFASKVAERLGINEAVAKGRLTSLAVNLAQHAEAEVEHAAAALIARGVDDVAKLLAHGPAEQTRAALAPEQVEPPESARATIGGGIPPESTDDGQPKDPSFSAGA